MSLFILLESKFYFIDIGKFMLNEEENLDFFALGLFPKHVPEEMMSRFSVRIKF